MKIYIAGKITGDPDYKQKFARAQEQLEEGGHIVLNPALLPQKLRQQDYLRICLAMLESADMVAFLPDFEESQGALIERDWCSYTNKLTMVLEG